MLGKKSSSARVQKALPEATKGSKESQEFDAIKRQSIRIIAHKTQKETRECPQTKVNIVAPYMNHKDAHIMTRFTQDVTNKSF